MDEAVRVAAAVHQRACERELVRLESKKGLAWLPVVVYIFNVSEDEIDHGQQIFFFDL
jgi:hypothetical protein